MKIAIMIRTTIIINLKKKEEQCSTKLLQVFDIGFKCRITRALNSIL